MVLKFLHKAVTSRPCERLSSRMSTARWEHCDYRPNLEYIKLERSMLLRRARESLVRRCGPSLRGLLLAFFGRDAKSDTTFMNHRRLSERMAAPFQKLSRCSRQLNFHLCLKHFSKPHLDSKVSLQVLDPYEPLTPQAGVMDACLVVCMFGSSSILVARSGHVHVYVNLRVEETKRVLAGRAGPSYAQP